MADHSALPYRNPAGGPLVSDRQPFLRIPFAAPQRYSVTEGWVYSAQETAIHGVRVHFAIDFGVPFGTDVRAAADGIAVQGYHIRYLGRLHNGRQVGYGLGHFVQIYHPAQGLCTCYAHLSEVFVAHVARSEERLSKAPGYVDCDPVGIYADPALLPGQEVRAGDLIGRTGTSGLALGQQESAAEAHARCQTWDEDHLHFEVYVRGADGRKSNYFDPYAIYDEAEQYRSPRSRSGTETSHAPLWLSGPDGTYRYAAD